MIQLHRIQTSCAALFVSLLLLNACGQVRHPADVAPLVRAQTTTKKIEAPALTTQSKPLDKKAAKPAALAASKYSAPKKAATVASQPEKTPVAAVAEEKPALEPIAIPAEAPKQKPTPVKYTPSVPSAAEAATTTTSATAKIMPYLLAIGDKISITIYGDETLSGEHVISQDGNVTVPVLGDIKAQGYTKPELEQNIRDGLISRGYFSNPQVTVAITEYQPIYIVGEVNKPGNYPYIPSLDVLKAVATAGGYTPRAKKEDFEIIRYVGTERKSFTGDEVTSIMPGDSIVVKQRWF